MAADPSTLADSRSMRAGTGIGIAIAVAATVGAIAFLAPRLREEMREDIFSGARTATVVPAPAVAPPAARAAGDPRPQPVALKPATAIVPPESLGPGEAEVAPPAAPHPVQAHKAASHHDRAPAVARKKSKPRVQQARAPAPRLVVDDTFADRPMRPAPAPRERGAAPRRPAHDGGRLVGGIPREDPFDYRTWRMHRNPDAPSNSPTDRQPG